MYVAVWVLVLAAGTIGLMILRQWGWNQIERAHVRDSFAEAWQSYENGDVVQAQKRVSLLLRARPERLPEAMDRFDTALLALPAAAREIERSTAARDLPPIERARHAVIFQSGEAADRTFAGASDSHRDVVLWQARQHVLAGRFNEARDDFEAYWIANSAARADTAAALRPKATDLKTNGAQAAGQLFWAGLWVAAIDVANQAREAGADDPSLLFFAALEAEDEQDKAASAVRYRECLEALPNHGLALRRLLVLEEG
jgi:hypothetical protein